MNLAAEIAQVAIDKDSWTGTPFVEPENLTNPQLMFVFFTYAYVLLTSSGMISDGSELLLLIPSVAGLVGSVVLPTLGAVPDGMMILFSGLGEDAQNEVAVGVGALAGSTVMLLTVTWFIAVFGGRVEIEDDGEPNYKARGVEGGEEWSKLKP